MAKKKTDAQLDREINAALSRSSGKTLDQYLQLANHAARWAGPAKARVQPSLRPYMKRVPTGGSVDRQFWLGEVLDDLRRAAENDLTTAEMKRLDQVMALITAKPPPGYGSTRD